MRVRHLARVFSIVCLLSLLLLKFQNCAPVHPVEAYSQPNDGGDSEVRIIDRWGNNKVEFLSPSYLVEDSVQVVNVQGLCVGVPRGHRLIWQLSDVVRGVLEVGMTECDMGQFQVQVKGLHFEDCQSQLELKAQALDSSEAPAVTVFRPFCES